MAALQSLDLAAADCAHYYHCVLHDVPLEMPLSEIAGQIVPRESSSPVKTLLDNHCKIVPHRLHMYKEPLPTKFGFITFFIHVGRECALEQEEIHQRMLEWIRGDLQLQMAHVKSKARLAQPPECYSSHLFLQTLSASCDIVNPTKVLDSKKMETFVLSKIDFDEDGKNQDANADAAKNVHGVVSEVSDDGESQPDQSESQPTTEPFTWTMVGRFPHTRLSSPELVWLKKQATDFPPLLVTNNDFAKAHCDPERLRAFFDASLKPLFRPE